MKRNHILSLLLAMAMMLSMVSLCILPVSAEGASDVWDGTADTTWYNDTDTTFTLTTAKQLAGLASLVNGGNTFAGKTVSLGADICLNTGSLNADNSWGGTTTAWTPIGTSSYAFSGTFLGHGHTVAGVYCSSGTYKGLFGNLSEATVSGVTVTGYVKGSTAGGRVGGIAANAVNSIIEDCHNYACVQLSANKKSNVNRAGGVVGVVGANTVVFRCTNHAKVYASNTTGGGKANAGGIVGESDATTTQRATIRACVNFGAVSAHTNTNNNLANNMAHGVGGVIGKAIYINIYDCANHGSITGSTSSYALMAGGIVGAIVGAATPKGYGVTMDGCENHASVSANVFAGGIIGSAYNYNNNTEHHSYISNSRNYGTVTALSDGESYAGGAIGRVHGNSSSSPQVFVSGIVNYGAVSGQGMVAGLACCDGTGSKYISDSVNYGNVTLTFSDACEGFVSGGVTANNGDTGHNFDGSYSLGTVTVIDNRADKTVAPVNACYVGGVSVGRFAKVENNFYAAQVTLPTAGEGEVGLTVTQGTDDAIAAELVTATGEGSLLAKLTAAGSSLKYMGAEGPVTYETYLVEQNLAAYGATVTLGDNLSVHLYVKPSALAEVNYTGATVLNADATVTMSEVTLGNGDTYVRFSLTDIAAADMGKTFTLAVSSTSADAADTAVAFTVKYGVATYASRMYGKGNDNLDALLVALMQYADAAETAKVGSSSVLDDFVGAKGIANPDLAAAYANVTLSPVQGVDSTCVKQVSADLTDSIRPVIEVQEGVAKVTVEIYGDDHTYNVTDGEVIIDCLTATSLNNVMTLTFLDSGDNVLGTTKYAVANYIKQVEALDLAKALAVYMQAARVFNNLPIE